MIVSSELPIVRILTVYLRPQVLTFVGAAVLAWFCIRVLGFSWMSLPTVPLTVVGVALSIFLGFRTTSSYDRYWEGRKLWGRMVNVSRHLTHQLLAYPHGDGRNKKAAQQLGEQLIARHAVYVHAFRCHCREQSPFDDLEVQRLADPDELERLRDSTNIPATLVSWQHLALADAARKGWITEEQLRSFDTSFHEILNVQGGCERILKTPLPTSYVYFSKNIVMVYGCALPFGFIETAGWTMLIIAPMAAICFLVIDTAGRLIQNPFSTGFYGLPLTALSITIERNIRQHLSGEVELPPPVLPGGPTGHVLM